MPIPGDPRPRIDRSARMPAMSQWSALAIGLMMSVAGGALAVGVAHDGALGRDLVCVTAGLVGVYAATRVTAARWFLALVAVAGLSGMLTYIGT